MANSNEINVKMSTVHAQKLVTYMLCCYVSELKNQLSCYCIEYEQKCRVDFRSMKTNE